MRFREELKKKKRLNRIELFVTIGILVASVLIMKFTEKKSKIVYDPDYDTRVLKFEWIMVPEGEFRMGDNFGDGNDNEHPAHMVYLNKYEISKFEVTYEQFDLICREAKRTYMANPQETVRGSRPVLVDNWDDASFFCRWVAQKTGRNIHLPTEAQWENAARGTDQRKYPWGNTEPNCGIVNFNNCVSGTQPVGSYPAGASPYGVMDMAGNAMEWTGDRYLGLYYYTILNPSYPVYAGYPAIARGGDYKSSAFDIRAMRRGNYPLNTGGIGFRVCKE
jgi:formylglycine-generating enzyme required for sulfatase activity